MGATLLIMAAGMGSRYGGNKQVDGLGPNGEILMEYSIYDAIRAGFDHVVFVIKPGMKELLAVGKAAGMTQKACRQIAEEIREKTRWLEDQHRDIKS